MSEAFNTIPFSQALSEIFAKAEHFSGQTYYEEMVRLFPQFQADGNALIPSEKEIERWILEENEFSVIEGKTSIPQAEQQLGIKIGEDYVYPNGMTDFEYNLNRVYKMGCLHYTDQCDFEQVIEFMEMAGTYTDEEEGERFSAEHKAAYACAWQNLHFHNYDEKDRVLVLQNDFNELCTLNPQLKRLKFNTNDVSSLSEVCAGVSFGFPVEDIQLFVSAHENGVFSVAKNEHMRIEQDMEREGLPRGFNFEWVPSTATIKAIGEKLREKERAALQPAIKREAPPHALTIAKGGWTR